MRFHTPLLSLLLLIVVQAAFAATEDIGLRDDKRALDLECRVHFPEHGEGLPLITLSHGFGGARSGPITDAVKASTLAFWNAYLKDHTPAKDSLASGSVFAAWEGSASIEAK